MQNRIVDEGSAEAPTYLVGQDRGGRWLAMEVEGRGGGMFATRDGAMRFARSQTARRPGAIREPARRIVFA